MCLALPLRLTDIKGDTGVVEMGGITRKINLSMVEKPAIGDYVIVHAGFAIAIMDEKEAMETLNLVRECIEKEEESEMQAKKLKV
jgi:hydrogenase expression/formation protein HypC